MNATFRELYLNVSTSTVHVDKIRVVSTRHIYMYYCMQIVCRHGYAHGGAYDHTHRLPRPLDILLPLLYPTLLLLLQLTQ